MSKLGWFVIALIVVVIGIAALSLMETARRQEEYERRREWEKSIRERLREQKERDEDAPN